MDKDIKLIMEENKINSWCVQLTVENKELVRNYFKTNFKTELNIDYISAVYGIDKKGKVNHNFIRNYKDTFDLILTTEEFYQKIGLVKENQELIIEIW